MPVSAAIVIPCPVSHRHAGTPRGKLIGTIGVELDMRQTAGKTALMEEGFSGFMLTLSQSLQEDSDTPIRKVAHSIIDRIDFIRLL